MRECTTWHFRKKVTKNGLIFSCERLLASWDSSTLEITNSLISYCSYDSEFNICLPFCTPSPFLLLLERIILTIQMFKNSVLAMNLQLSIFFFLLRNSGMFRVDWQRWQCSQKMKGSWIPEFVTVCTLHVLQHTACAMQSPEKELCCLGEKEKGEVLCAMKWQGKDIWRWKILLLATQAGRCPVGDIICSMKQGTHLGEKYEEDKGICVCQG